MARTTDSQNILSMYTLTNKTQLSSFLCFFQETNVGIYTLKTHMSAWELRRVSRPRRPLLEEVVKAKILSSQRHLHPQPDSVTIILKVTRGKGGAGDLPEKSLA